MEPHYADDGVTLYHGDCLAVMAKLPDNSVDAIVTDPPYGLGFMGKAWDGLPPGLPWAQECLRVLKPGGHLLAFGGTRTWHRLAVAVEDAGFEIRDSIAWLYGSGFPKSRDVAKAINVETGQRGERSAYVAPDGKPRPTAPRNWREGANDRRSTDRELPGSPVAAKWAGWGTALKPAFEPVVVARKPLVGTVAGNVQAWGTGALNIDGCRVEATDERKPVTGFKNKSLLNRTAQANDRPWMRAADPEASGAVQPHAGGRWPANVVLDGSQADALDTETGVLKSGAVAEHHTRHTVGGNGSTHGAMPGARGPIREASEGGASRFFPTFRYQAKAPTRERVKSDDGVSHPTVKPLELMRWLVRLVTPPGGVVLEPFAGSGTTVEAALLEGFRCIAIEREADYLPLITQRVTRARSTIATRATHEQPGLDL